MPTDKNQRKEEKAQMRSCALSDKGTVLTGKSGNVYRITSVLGAGGFGITYKAVAQVVLNKKTNYSQVMPFAIKEFFMKGCDRGADGASVHCSASMKSDMEQGKEGFRKEAEVLIKLNGLSPNIVKVNELFEANGTCYYVMDYLEGQSLQQYMDRSARHGLPEQEALALLLPIARAVELLHAHSLLHLDIKPDNIMLHTNPVDGTVTPVLIDFGLAKHFDKHGKPTSHLMARGATEGYAPLEQSGQITTFSPQMDVYALGATLFCMLTGKTPASALDIFHESISSYLQKNLPESISPQVRQLIADAMQPSMNDRMQTVGEFVKVLEQVAGKPEGNSGETSDVGGTVLFEFKKGKLEFMKRKGMKICFSVILVVAFLLGVCLLYDWYCERQIELQYKEAYYKAKEEQERNEKLFAEAETIEDYAALAEKGFAPAQNKLGECYYFGKEGASMDYKTAVYWFTKAAKQDNVKAQNNLGECYNRGLGVSTDVDEAVYWYTKAAEQGDVHALVGLGWCYYCRDDEKTIYWWTKAAEQGNAVGQGNLGYCYYDQRDYEKAVYWWQKAAEQNNETAQYNLAECYALGIGVSQNDETAKYWLEKAIENGYAPCKTISEIKTKRLN